MPTPRGRTASRGRGGRGRGRGRANASGGYHSTAAFKFTYSRYSHLLDNYLFQAELTFRHKPIQNKTQRKVKARGFHLDAGKLDFSPWDPQRRKFGKKMTILARDVLFVAEPDYSEAWTRAMHRHRKDVDSLMKMSKKLRNIAKGASPLIGCLPPMAPPPGCGSNGNGNETAAASAAASSVSAADWARSAQRRTGSMYAGLPVVDAEDTDEDDDGSDSSDTSHEDGGSGGSGARRRGTPPPDPKLAPAFNNNTGSHRGSSKMQMRYIQCEIDAEVGEALAVAAKKLIVSEHRLKASYLEKAYERVRRTVISTDEWRALLLVSQDTHDAAIGDNHDPSLLTGLLDALDLVKEHLEKARDDAIDVCERKLAEKEAIFERIQRQKDEMGIEAYNAMVAAKAARRLPSADEEAPRGPSLREMIEAFEHSLERLRALTF